MKRFSFLLIIVVLSSCSRDWKNPITVDPNLVQPVIEQIVLNAQNNIVLYLGKGYDQNYAITLERKTQGGFERISYVRLSQAALIDSSFDKEFDNNFVYRVLVEKNGYRTDYSAEKSFAYVSNILNAPQGLQATTLELQGIKIEWRDRSGKETGYKIEKNSGSGFVEIASLPENAQSHLDHIDGIPPLPLQLSYRVKAFNNALSSAWAEKSTEYTGIGVPTNLRITDSTAWHFTIEWQDNSNIETGYVVERIKNGVLVGEIAQLNANTIKYPDRIIEVGVYGYRVRAKKDNFYSLYSNEVSHNVRSVLPTEGLVASYLFNGNANDESGKGNHGTIYGATLAKDRFNRENHAYDFDGVNDYIDTFVLPPMNRFTFQSWIRPSLIKTTGILTNNVTYAIWPSYEISLQTDGKILVAIGKDNQGGRYSVISSSALVLNKWSHIICTYDGSSLSIYIDGELRCAVGATGYPWNNNKLAVIGTDSRPEGSPYPINYFQGSIDDVLIYNRALSEPEIQALYHEGGWAR